MISAIGESLPRVDAHDKATGKAKYTADIEIDGMLYAGLVRSPVRHAILHGVNIERALNQPGIVAVLTAEDIPGKLDHGAPYEDHPILAYDRLRFIGEPCAIVVVKNREELSKPIASVELDFEEILPVTSLEAAMEEGAVSVHEEGNLIERHIVEHGDIEDGFAQAVHIIEATYTTDWQEHAALELDAVIAFIDEEGRLSVIAPSQNPFSVRSVVAQTMSMEPEEIRVIQPDIGGSFGGKNDFIYQLGAHAALAAWNLEKPVQIVLSREESILTGNKRHPMALRHRVGVTADGRICAWEVYMAADGGAYAATSPFVIWRAVTHGCGPYQVPNARVVGEAYYTNSVPAASMRGFGAVQATYAAERHIDRIAASLKLDPVELRRLNMVRPGSVIITGDRLSESVGLEQALNRALELGEYLPMQDIQELPAHSKTGKVKGKGVALASYGVSLGAGEGRDYAGATVELSDDGIVVCNTGMTDLGTGVLTAFTQILSETLSVPVERICVRRVDTVVSPESNKTVASRSTFVGGMAVHKAASDLKKRVIDFAAGLVEGTDGELDLINGEIVDLQTSKKTGIGLDELAAQSQEKGITLHSDFHHELPPLEWNRSVGQGEAYYCYAYSAQVADVTVDLATGKVDVDRLSVVVDCGRAINPDAVLGQIYGGAVMGAGYALLEELGMDAGKVTNLNFDKYLLLTAVDIGEIRADIVEAPDPTGPFGAKGIAELVTVGVAPAIVNAICNAIGEQRDEIPVNLERTFLGYSLRKS